MFQSTQHKTSDGKRKRKGKRKPVAMKQAKIRRTALIKRLQSP